MKRLVAALALSVVLVSAGTATAGPWRSRGGCGVPVAAAPACGGYRWSSPGWTYPPTWGNPNLGPGRFLYEVPPAPPGRFLSVPGASPTPAPADTTPLVMPAPKPAPADKR